MATSRIVTGPGREIEPSIFDKHGTILLESINPNEENTCSWLFRDPATVIQCTSSRMVPACIEQIEKITEKGMYAAGFISYEAGAAWTPGARETISPGFPLLWFGLYNDVERFESPLLLPVSNHTDERIDHSLDASRKEYEGCTRKILQHIRDGETYQVNYTTRTRFHWRHGAWQLYLRLRRSQPVPYGAFLNCGRFSLVSLSPELFLTKRGRTLHSRPMKGTAPRGTDWPSDDRLFKWLGSDLKNLAENRMIVDLMRNDLGSIAEPGTVQVHDAFKVEPYSSLFQMTSGVKCRLRKGVDLGKILRATFPPGSITGAPKISTMQIISELEKTPRKAYTGAIGFIDPHRDLVLNVAIRTIIAGDSGACEMGVGSGILSDSVPEEEYRETCLKAGFLNPAPRERIDLFETMLLQENGILLWYKEHLDRLEYSANELGYCFLREEAITAIDRHLGSRAIGPAIVRLILSKTGDISAEVLPLTPLTKGPKKLMVSRSRTDPTDVLLGHKTTSRIIYERELDEAKKLSCVDALFLNTSGYLTEGTFTNLFVLGPSGWRTPSVQCGLLPGIWRQKFLESSGAATATLRIDELATAKSILIGNSVRGSMEIDEVIDADGSVLYTRQSSASIHQLLPPPGIPVN